MEALSSILVLAGLGGGGYAVWRLVRRRRNRGDPPGHPRLRVIGIAAIAALILGGAFAPEQDRDAEPDRFAQEARQETGRSGSVRQAERRDREQAARREHEIPERHRRAEQGETALVTRVVDGDTVELQGVGPVRLIGVDTPERGEECYDEATAYLRRRVAGETVRYRYQSERTDRYDRELLDLFRGGQLVNLSIAQAGWGEELTIAPNDLYASRIRKAEAEARARPRGRWTGCIDEAKPQSRPQPKPRPRSGKGKNDGGSSAEGGGGGRAVPDGTCDEIGLNDFPVPPGDPRDGDGDGIACES